MPRLILLMVISAFCIAACGQGENSTQAAESRSDADFQVVEIASGLAHPWALAFLPNGDYLVTERGGRLLRLTQTGDKVDIRGVPSVYDKGQGGLLDIALEPDFKDGGWVYFSYAAADKSGKANTEVARARLDLARNTLTDLRVIFKASPKVSGSNHWGSRLVFGDDGALYITLGDRYNHKERAQDVTSHFGTVVRLMPDGKIPEDNPFINQAEALPEIFSYGHRNIQGAAVHPVTRKVWIHEHGPRGGDEINILKAGANHGWPAVTYGINYWGTKISDKTSAPGMEDPVHQWTPSIAPSGMAFYTGDAFPHWQGNLFVGALAGEQLQRLVLEGDKVREIDVLLADRGERIRDVRQGRDGYIYLLTDAPKGKLLRLEP